MRNGFEIIDAHCHLYPEKIASRAVAGTDAFYGTVSACLGTAADLTEEADAAGIDRMIVQSVATTPKQVTSINRFIADSVASSGGRWIGLGTLHPDSADQAADVAAVRELGLHGVKLHPDIQNFNVDDPRSLRICELCEAAGLPILMHTGDRRYDHSNPNRLLLVLKAYPALTVIGAHFGGWSIWEEAWKELAGLPNFYVDCSSSFYYLDRERAAAITRAYGADRVLFGTDYPMWKPAKELDFFFSLRLTEEEQKQILSENAKKVFRF